MHKTFELINLIYSGKPFQDSNGQITLIPDKIDCLIDSISLYERFFYEHPDQVTSSLQLSFLEKTKDFILTIPIAEFIDKIRDLEFSSREIILRTLDQICQTYPDCTEFQKYSTAFCS